MKLSTHLSLKFAAVATFCTTITLLFVIGGMAMEIQDAVDREQRRVSHIASEIFSKNCASMLSHLAALAGGNNLRVVVQYVPERSNEFLAREKPISHADHLYLVKRACGECPLELMGEAVGNDFIKQINEYAAFFNRFRDSDNIKPLELQSGNVGGGVAIQIPTNTQEYFWLFGVVELEERVVENIGHLLGIEASLLDGYPKERSIFRFYQDLFKASEYAGLVELRGCNGEHVAWLEFKFPLLPYHKALSRQTGQAMIVAFFFIAASIAWGVAEARKIARPIVAIQQAATAMSSGNLDARAEVRSSAAVELIELTAAFNEMASRIESNIKERETLLIIVAKQLHSSTRTLRNLSKNYEQQ